jgi:hypothetical protein
MASSAQAKQFIETIGPIIQEEAKARGYKVCSPIIAQACVESGYNTSLLSLKFHNYHGLKCGSYWTGPSVNLKTKEEYNSQLVSIRDNFRVFPDMVSGVKGYFDFISTKRYANLKGASTAQEYLELIKKDGYATSSSYVSTCMNVVTRYGLESFDFGVYKPITPELILEVVNGDWGNGAVRRTKLTASGYNYDDVRAKVNALNRIGKEFIPEIKDQAGDYWLSVVKLMAL